MENLIPIKEVSKHIPGHRVSLPTVYRWFRKGLRGTKLETCLVGVRRYTTKDAIDRFLAATQEDESSIFVPQGHEAADAELLSDGI